MHILSIPRHQIETHFTDYLRIAQSLLCPATSEDAVRSFEHEFARYVGCRHAIAVASGRLGIHLILEAIDAPQGSEAIVPAFNLFAVIERFCQLGITPRFCDIRIDDLNIDVDDVERRITPNTKYILATHMFGHPADMTRLIQLAQRHGLILFEDCAHALGSKIDGRMVGTFGRASIFSFSVLKLVTTFGGGMIATNDDRLASRIRAMLATHAAEYSLAGGLKKALTGTIMDLGTRKAIFSLCAWPALRLMRAMRPNFQQQIMTESPRLDRNFEPKTVAPLHPFQARLGRDQLSQVEEFIANRRQVGQWLDQELSAIPQIRLLQCSATSLHNGLYYGVLADKAPQLAEYLFRHGIDCETSEYRNCAALEIYRDYATDCPVARRVESQILRLPNYPSLSQRSVHRIGKTIRAFYQAA
jgi:dTDP-4-amino-4,6-dideoxygalactose transaminase